MRLQPFSMATMAVLLIACGTGPVTELPPNRWSDERLWPVLKAQEQRDTEALCALLKHTAAEVREAAALAFASVQDTLGIPCLLDALNDGTGAVRSTAVFALGFVADSLTIERMAELAVTESDSTVQRAYLSASFLAMQRGGRLKEPAAIIYFLQSSGGQDRVRAADGLRRLPDSVLMAMEADYIRLVEDEQDVEVQAILVRGLGKIGSPEARGVLRDLVKNSRSELVSMNALRAIGYQADSADLELIWGRLGEGQTGAIALEALQQQASLNYQRLLFVQNKGYRSTYALRALTAKHAPSHVAASILADLKTNARSDNSPYARALLITALSELQGGITFADALVLLKDSGHAAVRQAAFQAAVRSARDHMMRSRFSSPEAQYAQLAGIVAAAINTSDAGLICAAAELLQEKVADAIRILLPTELEKKAVAALEPIRDLEARILLDQAVAKRDGLPPPTHQPPPFNHPIDPAKLRALKQGQRYRITTTKGNIILATDVNDCPGSSLAFDSLVTAGYYNGKAFHRMVPNFVVQGGCPRGDGYGGMDWTLRTEIGRKLFTAGSVGLASAGRDTESCQFFITHSATPHLDGRYTRFGEVVEGMDVVWRLQVGDVMEKVERVE